MKYTEYSLTILSGMHAGAQIKIEQESFTIGSEESCDIRVMDEVIKGKQITVSVHNNAFKAVLGASYPNTFGHQFKEQDEVFYLFNIEDIFFIIAKQEFINAKKNFEKEVKQLCAKQYTDFFNLEENENIEGSNTGGVDKETKTEDTGQKNQNDNQEDSKADEEESSGKKNKLKRSKKSKKNKNNKFWKWKKSILVTFISVIIIGVGYSVFNFKMNDNQDSELVIDCNKVYNYVQLQFPYTNTTYLNGQSVLQGRIKNHREMEVIKAIYYQSNCFNDFLVYIEENVVKLAKEMLISIGETDIDIVHDHRNNVLRALGVVKNISVWNDFKENLVSEVSTINFIQDDTMDIIKTKILIDNIVDTYNMTGYIVTKIQNGMINVNMVSSRETVKNWGKILFTVNQKVNNKIKFNINQVNLNQLGIVGVNCCESAYLILRDGSRYMKGAALKNGTKILDIQETYITLIMDDLILNLPIK